MKLLVNYLLYIFLVLIVLLADNALSMNCFSEKVQLLEAVEESDYKKINLFVSKSCDLKVMSNEFGLDLLDVAVRNDDIEMIKMLHQNKLDVNNINWLGKLSISSCQSIEMAKLLIKLGVDINFSGKEGLTPVHDLIISGKYKVAEFAINKGATINIKDNFGFTPLMFATKIGPVSFVKFLIDNGAKLNDRNNVHDTALHIAVLRGDLEVVQLLVEAGADINAVDIRRETPLHLAATDGKAEIVKYLVEKGADVNRFNAQGNTPLWNAYNKRPYPGRVKKENRKEVIEILQKAGGI